MEKRVLIAEIYAYAVCLITACVFIYGATTGVYGIVQVSWPQRTLQIDRWPSYDYLQFWQMASGSIGGPALPESRVKSMWEEHTRTLIMQERNRGFEDTVKGALMIALAVPLFVFHWKKATQFRSGP